MTLLKIAEFGHPVLLEVAKEVTDFESPTLQRLVDDMIETMKDAQGVGLAAPQVYQSLRLFVAKRMDLADRNSDIPALVLINPALEWIEDELVQGVEGCLSIPGMRGLVPRHERVRYTGFDRFGRLVEGLAQGYFARILQHEFDHLDGILYPSRISDWRHMAMNSQAAHLERLLQEGPDAPPFA